MASKAWQGPDRVIRVVSSGTEVSFRPKPDLADVRRTVGLLRRTCLGASCCPPAPRPCVSPAGGFCAPNRKTPLCGALAGIAMANRPAHYLAGHFHSNSTKAARGRPLVSFVDVARIRRQAYPAERRSLAPRLTRPVGTPYRPGHAILSGTPNKRAIAIALSIPFSGEVRPINAK